MSRLVSGYANAKIARVFEHAPEPVLFARVQLTMLQDAAVTRPAIAQANVDLNGRQVRAQVAARAMRAAIDLLQDRIRGRLRRADRH